MAINNRREFLIKTGKYTLAGLSVISFGYLLNACEQNESPIKTEGPQSFDLTEYEPLMQVGGVSYIFLKDIPDPLIVIRKSEDSFLVYSSVCSHQGCNVDVPAPGSDIMVCPCHFAKYNVHDGSVAEKPNDGTNIKGLKKFVSKFDSNTNVLEVMM
jgi:Rieske Fe-S protein